MDTSAPNSEDDLVTVRASEPEQDDALPLSGLQHLTFCPRQWALIHLEQAWAENHLIAEGQLLHERVDRPEQSRGRDLRTVVWINAGEPAIAADRPRRRC